MEKLDYGTKEEFEVDYCYPQPKVDHLDETRCLDGHVIVLDRRSGLGGLKGGWCNKCNVAYSETE